MPEYYTILVEQHTKVLMAETGVTSSTADTMTMMVDLLAHTKAMAVMRATAVDTSCKEYLACKFLLLSNGERYKPLCTHPQNGHAEGKKPCPTTVEGMKTLMVDYKVPRVAAPRASRKDKDNQGRAFAKTQEQEWANTETTLT